MAARVADRAPLPRGAAAAVRPATYSRDVPSTPSSPLPEGIAAILEHLAGMARGYNNHLKWNEVAKLKADLMNTPARWRAVPVARVRERCLDLGMRAEDVDEIVDLVTRAQAGRRLMPQAGYRDFRFAQPVDAVDNAAAGTFRPSRVW